MNDGKDNPGFNHDITIIPTNGEIMMTSPEKKMGDLELNEKEKTPTLSPNGTLSLPLYEISLNGNSIKKLTLSSGKSIGGDDNHDNDHDNEEQDMRCGLGCFSPDWIQQFATKKSF